MTSQLQGQCCLLQKSRCLERVQLSHNRLRLSQSASRRHPCRSLHIRAESSRGGGGGGFAAGFLVGGTIFGALGYIFAPQLADRLRLKVLSAIQSAADLLGNLKAMGETKDPAEGHNRFEAYAVSPYCPEAKISAALLSEDQRLRLPRFLDDKEDKDPEATKQDLSDKIAQLNAAIDDVSAQLKAQDQVMSSVDDGSSA